MQNYAQSRPLPEICASREALLSIFEERAKNQCVYIHAPGGYGKTISGMLWLKKTQRPYAWLTLDAYDNMLSVFCRGFCRALLAIAPQEEPVARFLSSPSFSAAPVESTMEFLSMLHWQEGRSALVLDDLHSITNVDILKALPYMFKRLPAFVNVLLLSRTPPPDALRAMLENGSGDAFITDRELIFSPEEIRSHYASYGRFITSEKASDIYAYTGGWIIILNAMIESGNLEPEYADPQSSFGAFFEKNIWNGFDEATQAFLLKTSVVDSFTLALCERLTESADCAETLDMLIRGNINLSRQDGEYRYHSLFLEFLRKRLQTSGIEQKRLFVVAAHYYLQENEFYKAAQCALSSADAETDMRVIQSFFQSKTPTLDQYFELAQIYDIKNLTDDYCRTRPILYMPNILSAFLSGEVENTRRLFDLFYAALPAFVELKHPIADVAVTRLILDDRVKLAELPALMDSMGLPKGKKVSGQAAVVTMQMPMLHRSNRDYTEFLHAGTKEIVHGLLSGLLPDDCEFFYQSVTAGLLMEQNRLAEALETALAAYHSMGKGVSCEILFGVSVGLAEIYALRDETEQGQAVLGRLRQWMRDHQALHLLKNLMAYEERHIIADGDHQAARSWLDHYFVSDHAFGEFHRMYQNFTTVRAYIVLSMTDKAAAALGQLHHLATGIHRPLDIAEANVLLAVVEWISGKKNEARDRLHGLLAEVLPHRYIRIMANEGRAVLPILAAVLKKLDKEAAKDEALYGFAKEVQVAAYEQAQRCQGITHSQQLKAIHLSPKQTLILELLAKGHKNAEIVHMTGYSINTVRSYTKIIYEKLAVNNVMDALVKAKQLGMLK